MPMLLGFGAVNHLENCFFTDLYLVLFLRIRLQHRNLVKLESEDAAAAGLFSDPADRTCAPGELTRHCAGKGRHRAEKSPDS